MTDNPVCVKLCLSNWLRKVWTTSDRFTKPSRPKLPCRHDPSALFPAGLRSTFHDLQGWLSWLCDMLGLRAFGTPKFLECNPHSNLNKAGVLDCTPDWHSGLDWHSAFPSKIGRSFGLLHSTECHSKCPVTTVNLIRWQK